MLIDFFATLRAAKLPVSVREYLTLLEALKAGVIDDDSGPSIDKFYFLARTTLVKDETLFDKFDRAFSAYIRGVTLRADFTQEVPLEWLRKTLELELSAEQRAAIEKMGWTPATVIVASDFAPELGWWTPHNAVFANNRRSPEALKDYIAFFPPRMRTRPIPW